MNNIDKVGLILLALVIITLVQAYRMAKFAKKNMAPEADMLQTTLNVLVPKYEHSLIGFTFVPLKYYFQLMTGSLLTSVKSITTVLVNMTDEQSDNLNKDIDQVIHLVEYFITPAIVIPTTAEADDYNDYTVRAMTVCKILAEDAVAGNLDRHITRQLLLYCKNNNRKLTDVLSDVNKLAVGLDKTYINQLIREAKQDKEA